MKNYEFTSLNFGNFQDKFLLNTKKYEELADLLCEKAKTILNNQDQWKQIFDISEKFDVYYSKDHVLNWNELENILAYNIVSDYSKFAIYKEEKRYSNREGYESFFFFLTLKYQFLVMKIKKIKIIDHLMSKFIQNQSEREQNCKSNLVSSFLVKYLSKNPKEMEFHIFDQVTGDLLYLINPEKDEINGTKIEWPLKFLQLLEKFMNSQVCFNYIQCVDLLERNHVTKKYSLKNICSAEDYKEHCRILIYEYLQKKSYIYVGNREIIARNIYNGAIIFNENHQFQKYYSCLEMITSQAYLLMLCTHELLHLKRILFAQGGVYQWGTPNISPFNHNLKNFPNEGYPEIGDSFELEVVGFYINQNMTKNVEDCERILNSVLWNEKNGIKRVSPDNKEENQKSTIGDKKAFNHRNQHCGHSCDSSKYYDYEEALLQMIEIRKKSNQSNLN